MFILMTNVLQESLIVGLYSCIVFLGCSIFLTDKISLLFVTGFFKHFLGYFSGIHGYYCKKGCGKDKAFIQLSDLFAQSILEGLLFVSLGYKLSRVHFIHIFFIGILLHIVFEALGIHKYFCHYYCFSIQRVK